MKKIIIFMLSIYTTIPATARVATYDGKSVTIQGYGIDTWKASPITANKNNVGSKCDAACSALGFNDKRKASYQITAGQYECICQK